jgi:hypothetical protein
MQMSQTFDEIITNPCEERPQYSNNTNVTPFITSTALQSSMLLPANDIQGALQTNSVLITSSKDFYLNKVKHVKLQGIV